MSAFRTSPDAIIKLIRDALSFENLSDDPKEVLIFILKEIIQNADDCRSKRLSIGLSKGIVNAKHLLMQDSGILIVNDGCFRRVDSKNIQSIGISSNEDDSSRIGKFGIGLKTVFLICEAFFYCARYGEPFTELSVDSNDLSQFLNPWQDDRQTDEKDCNSTIWDRQEFSNEDQELLVNQCQKMGFEDGFKIWFPIRKESHCKRGNKIKSIEKRYYGDIENLARIKETFSKLADDLANLLPLLKSLNTIAIFDGEKTREIRLEHGSQCFEHFNKYREDLLNGEITVSNSINDNKPNKCQYFGYQKVLDNKELKSIKDEEEWSKAIEHCAVTIFKQPRFDPKAKLKIQWAVFLPTSKEVESNSIEGEWDYILTFHGFFFPESDRRGIISWDNNKQLNTKQRWNKILAEQGTFTLLIPALENFAKESLPGVVKNLVEALQKTSLWKKYKQHICINGIWVYGIQYSYSKQPSWYFVSGNTNCLVISESIATLIPNIFPRFVEVCANYILVVKEWPNLTYEGFRFNSWEVSDVVKILEVESKDAVTICADSSNIEALYSFLESSKETLKCDVVKNQLCKFLHAAFRDKEFQSSSNLEKLISWISSETILVLPKGLPQEIEHNLLNLQLNCLIIPSVVNANEKYSNKLSIKSARDILNILEDIKENSAVQKLVKNILIPLEFELKNIDSEECKNIKNMRLIPIKIVQHNKEVIKPILNFQSLNTINKLSQEFRLFKGGDNSLLQSLAGALRQSIYIVESTWQNICVFNIDLCNEDTLQRKLYYDPLPLNSDPNQRHNLLKELLGFSRRRKSYELKIVIRYLLHGNIDHHNDIDSPLHGVTEQQTVWSKTLKHLVKATDQWRFIDSCLIKTLSSEDFQELNIHHIDVNGVLQELKLIANQDDLRNLNWQEFSREERETLIYALPSDFVKQLRLHETIDGISNSSLVFLNSYTYLKDEKNKESLSISSEFAKKFGIVLLRQSDRPEVALCQAKLSPPIHAVTWLDYLLNSDEPERYCTEILNTLQHSISDCLNKEALSVIKWLPAKQNLAYAPKDIIYLKEIEGQIQRITAECNGLYLALIDLSEEVKRHPAFSILRDRLLPKRSKALEMFGKLLLLIDNNQYCVGSLSESIKNDDQVWTAWLQIFQELNAVMPAADFLNKLNSKSKQETFFLFELLAQPLESGRLIQVLNSVSHKHSHYQSSKLKESALKIYCLYLELAVQHCDWNQILSKIKLLSVAQEWKPADKLCYGASDIDPCDILNDNIGRLIQDHIQVANSVEITTNTVEKSYLNLETKSQEDIYLQEVKDTDAILQRYFEAWPRQTDNTIALLLRVIGGRKNSNLQNLAKQYYSGIDFYLEDLALDESVEFLRDDINTTIFVVDEHCENTKVVTSIIGLPLQVRLLDESSAGSLIVGSICRPLSISGINYIRVSLRRITSISNDIVLNRLAKQSFKQIIESAYGYEIKNLDTFWEKLQSAAPPDIRQTQNMLLNEAIISLRSQLRLDRNSYVNGLIRQRFDLQREREEILAAQEKYPDRKQTYHEKLSQNEKQFQANKQKLRQLFQDQEAKEIHDAFLASVKQRIQNASYDKFSIPFELFQNADDACCELYNMGDSQVSRLFSVTLGNNQLLFSHWGRSINQYSFRGQDYWKEKGYDQDLLKMLLLNFSDKSEGVTGKFGLGFKTVFLLSSAPRVISERIGFEVIGGIYPREIDKQAFMEMQRQLEGKETGTLIQLKVNGVEAKPVIQKFEKCVSLLGAFSSWLKEFKIRIQDDKFNWKWSEVLIENCSNLYYCKSTEIKSKKNLYFLALGKSHQRCLLQLNSRGLEPLSCEYPTFWVTAPTRINLNVGFAVNAPFHLDVGRSQLDLDGGGKDYNQKLAKNVGTEFGQALVRLAQLDDSELCHALNLAKGTTRLGFWRSLWGVLGEGLAKQAISTKGIALLRMMFWSEDCGLALVCRDFDVIPTGLPTDAGKFCTLTRIPDIHWQVQGILNPQGDRVDCKILNQVLQWPVLNSGQHHIEPGNLVSSKIANYLKELAGKSVEILNLLKILQWQVGSNKCVNPEMSEMMGKVLNSACFEKLQDSEHKDILNFLNTLEFQAVDGQWYLANQLLVKDIVSDRDELLMANLAPSSALLSEDYYILDECQFFFTCRQSQRISVNIIGSWILKSIPAKRIFCIYYLLNGKYRDDVINWLMKNLANSWLENLPNQRIEWLKQPKIISYSFDDILYRLGLLSPAEPSQINPQNEPTKSIEPVIKPPIPQKTLNSTLQDLLFWWKENRSDLIEKYENSLYPNFDDILTTGNYSGDRPETAKRWLTLFTLGALQTMGRSKPEQHRNFLRHCDDWGWLDVMVSGKVNETAWINLLTDYFAMPKAIDNLEYYQWVRYYPAFYAFSRWWQEYRESLLSANEQQSHISFPYLLNPQLNQTLQGTGSGDAPPAGSLLGIGAIFVVRELMRAGILSSCGMRPYAYVPTQRVRAVLYSIGCKSVQKSNTKTTVEYSQYIHDFLIQYLSKEDATFCGDYDLPFLMLSKEPETVQKELLNNILQEPNDDDDVSNWQQISSNESGDFVTLKNGQVIPRSYMN